MGGRDALRGLLLFVAVLSASAANSVSPPKNAPKFSFPAPPANDGGAGPSTAAFPVYGDVYPNGIYYAVMSIGDPPKTYFLDVDTGNALTWVECDAPCVHCYKGPHPWYQPRKEKMIPCRDRRCIAVQEIAPPSPGTPPGPSCTQCDYDIKYMDDASSVGVVLADAFTMRLTNSSVVRPSLAFGCGYNQQGIRKTEQVTTDGMLGLGNAKAGVLWQLSVLKVTKNVVGHCLGSSAGKGSVAGFVFFGDAFIPADRMTWAPMAPAGVGPVNHYSLGPAALYYGTQSVRVKMMNVILDTGSSYTYLESQPYQALLTAVRNDLSGKPQIAEVHDTVLPICWKGQKPFKTVGDVKSYFKPLALNFVNGNGASLYLPPENYLIVDKDGNACLGILNGSEVGLNLNVIGDVSLQDLLVAYDNEKRRIGWVRRACTKPSYAEDEEEDRGLGQLH